MVLLRIFVVISLFSLSFAWLSYETVNRRPRLIQKIPYLKKCWMFSVDIRPYGATIGSYASLLHATIGYNWQTYGSRTPALFFLPKSHRLHICAPINGNKNHCYDSSGLRTDRYTNVRIEQKLVQGYKYNKRYQYTIHIGGKLVYSVYNKDTREFRNVKVYAPDYYYKAAKAYINNFLFKNIDCVSPPPPDHPKENTFSNCLAPLSCAKCDRFQSSSGFRSINGICNNLAKPTSGAANTPLGRLIPASYAGGKDTPRGFPGTRPIVPPANKVSKVAFQVEQENKGNSRKLSILLMTFGQFLDHDVALVRHAECDVKDCSKPDAFKYPCFPIKFTTGRSECTPFGRSLPVCQFVKKSQRGPREHLNLITHSIDGSNIYGSSLGLNQRLRRQDGTGELKVTKDNLLPIDEEIRECKIRGGCSLVGEERGDENIALTTMHTLWVREHNRIARGLRKINPTWEETQVYETARKINVAQYQHIIYNEFLPNLVTLPKYAGYNVRNFLQLFNAFSAAAYRFGHSLIPNSFPLLNKNFDVIRKPQSLQDSFMNRAFYSQNGIESLMFGLIGNQSNPVDTGFAYGIARRLFVPLGENTHMDLTAFNIQRGRDHGIPTYGAWRKFCGLPAVTSFASLYTVMPKSAIIGFQALYNSPNDIDLFAAGIAEKHVKRYINGKLVELSVGPTFECIFRHQFSLLRDGDRFFYEAENVFTPSQLNTIKNVTMSRILCNNLKGIVSIQQNAFFAGNVDGAKRKGCYLLPNLDLNQWK